MTDANTDYVEETDIVTYEAADGIAWIAMNRPKYNNAQNGRCLLYTSPSPRDA